MNLPLFFDRFGLIVFLFILVDAIYGLNKKKLNKNEKIRTWIRVFIGVAGLIVDGFFVISQDILGVVL